MDRFTDINGNTNPTQKALRNNPPNISRSKFNLSRVVEQTMEFGRIHVLDVIETIPGDTFSALDYIISLQSRNPTVKRPQTGMRMYVHAHYMRWSDIWEGAQNYIDCGNTGKINKQMPTLQTWLYADTMFNEWINLASPGSLIDEIGAPATVFDKQRTRLSAPFGAIQTTENLIQGNRYYPNGTINALPFAMYQMICLEKYFDRNLIQTNKHWVPENQHHWILPYNAEECIVLDYEKPKPDKTEIDTSGNAIEGAGNRRHINPNGKLIIPQDEETPVFLAMPRYALKKGDYFTTGLPFSMLLRGDIPTVNIATAISSIDWSDAIYYGTSTSTIDRIIGINETTKKLMVGNGVVQGAGNAITAGADGLGPWSTQGDAANSIYFTTNLGTQDILRETLNKAKINTVVNAQIDMATLNALEALTIYRQRMALTDGKYNSMIEAQFGYNPQAPNNAPLYIGGFYLDITGQDIVQSSETNTTPLGTKAGRLDTINSGQIGTFHAKDYGYIMVTAYIQPDTFYNSGLERQITRKRQDEVYFPIFNNLAPQPILNKELYWSMDENTDNDIFAWTERYSDYKSRVNRVKGLLAISDLDDSTYTMQQWYDTTPMLNNKFMSLSQENVDMGVFAVDSEPPFVATIGQHVEVVRAMPYVTMPAGLRGGTQ